MIEGESTSRRCSEPDKLKWSRPGNANGDGVMTLVCVARPLSLIVIKRDDLIALAGFVLSAIFNRAAARRSGRSICLAPNASTAAQFSCVIALALLAACARVPPSHASVSPTPHVEMVRPTESVPPTGSVSPNVSVSPTVSVPPTASVSSIASVSPSAPAGPTATPVARAGHPLPTTAETPSTPEPPTKPLPAKLAIRVVGNRLVDGQGQPLRLIGVNVMAGKPCVQSGDKAAVIFVPSPTDAVAAMATWHVNVVRLTLNEDCWLGINRVDSAYSGSSYQKVIVDFVRRLHERGIYAIVDLHLNAPGTEQADAQQVMADADHAPDYWRSVAAAFKDDPAVIFQPYNEPHLTPANVLNSTPWTCWRDGCTVTELATCEHCKPTALRWQTAGMQSLVTAIRSTGASNPILLGGLNWSQDLTRILEYLPTDPRHQLIVSYHNYRGPRNTSAYWDRVIAPLAETLPVVTDELGEKDCQTTFVASYMAWADAHGVSYLPWVWTNWKCDAFGLLADWDGHPSAYGLTFYDHFRALRPAVPSNSAPR